VRPCEGRYGAVALTDEVYLGANPPLRAAPLRSACLRSTPERSNVSNFVVGFSSFLHLFQTSTPYFSSATYSSSAICLSYLGFYVRYRPIVAALRLR
jgi:hypothetical protein